MTHGISVDFSLIFFQNSETLPEYNIRKTSLADKFDPWRFSSAFLKDLL